MDKQWMNLPRNCEEFEKGVEFFLNYAFSNASINSKICCPCKDCKMGICVTRETAKEHLIVKGFIKGYTHWIAHGELWMNSASTSDAHNIPHDGSQHEGDDMWGLLHDAFAFPTETDGAACYDMVNRNDMPDITNVKFYKLVHDSKKELYPGCKNFSKLSFIIRLLHLKCSGKWSDKSFNMLLDLLREAFPKAFLDLPKNVYEANKLMRGLGLGYEKYDACPNDCTLYWGDKADWRVCKTCKTLRWVPSENDPTGEKRKIAHKVLWHFPLKPRLQRLFLSSKTSSSMKWHVDGRIKDGCMRHPADSPAWKDFDHRNPDFAADPRNVRLGLASDGFNPFKNLSVAHSTWPVVLIPYNLPPWMAMKEPYLIMSLLIPGPTAPGNNIDIYLQPLIHELKELWNVGVNTYDSCTKQKFQLRAALMWTISDFPGYATLSGWSTKGEYACPVCHKYTHSKWLKHGGKHCYMGHRRFLEPNHAFRKDAQSFDGTVENGKKPPLLTGTMALNELKDCNVQFGKLVDHNPKLPFSWKKRSIFFELPYWEHNILRHNLDLMHIEKNVCENICNTLLDMEKSKDNAKSRLDLKEMGIRAELHPVDRENGKAILPPASFKMKKKEKVIFCKILKNVKVPDGYSANISRCIHLKPPKISGLKSHDNHILMQQLLPISLRKTLPRAVRYPLIRLCRYFRILCSKEIHPTDVFQLEKDIAVILCQMEKIFPPSFFDVMVHLTIHLAYEVRIAGPVEYRWMYPIERYLGKLKTYVRNRSRPEGCIAEGYIAEECLSFCSLYLADYVETKFNRTNRNEEVNVPYSGLEIFAGVGRSLGKGTPTIFDADTLRRAHQYILFNCDKLKPYIDLHHRIVEKEHPRVNKHEIERIHVEQFAGWLSKHIEVEGEQIHSDNLHTNDLKSLSRGPNMMGWQYEKFLVNGFRFHTRDVERKRKTQNSGVSVNATTSSYANTRDQNPVLGEMAYYGILSRIIELDYRHGRRIVLFDCDWVSKGKKLKQDEDGFTLANFTQVKRHDEPFILASQASQVFYVADPHESGWHVVIATHPRFAYKVEPACDVEEYLQSETGIPKEDDSIEGAIRWVRKGVRGVEVNIDNV